MALITQKTVKFVGVASLVIVTALGGVLVAQPLYNQVTTQNAELTSVQDELTTMQTARDGLDTAKDQYDDIQAINDQLKAQFPELANVPDLLDSITLGAVESGITPTDISSITFGNPTVAVPAVPEVAPTTEGEAPAEGETPPADDAAAAPADGATADTTVSTGEYAEMEIGIAATGNPQAIQQFLSYLNTMDRVMIINTFSVDTTEAEDTGAVSNLSLTGKVYIYKAILTPEQSLQQAEQVAAGEVPADGTVTEDTTTE